jgi:hypothetical protein
VAYAVENAIFEWRDGERRVREAQGLDRAVEAVVDELRRRLGSRFLIAELATFYSRGVDWATDLARRRGAGTEAAAVVDAAFSRYAREASDYAGGRARESHARPD